MRARDCVWRQPSDADFCPSIQLTRKLAGYWVNSVEQEQVRRARDQNPNSPNKGATPARQVRFPGIRPQPKRRIYGRLCQGQALGSAAAAWGQVLGSISNQVVRKGQLAIGEEEVRITSNSLVKEVHSVGKIHGWPQADLGVVNYGESADVEIIGDQVLSWFFFNRRLL